MRYGATAQIGPMLPQFRGF